MDIYEAPQITKIGSLADTTLALGASSKKDFVFATVLGHTVVDHEGHGFLNASLHIL